MAISLLPGLIVSKTQLTSFVRLRLSKTQRILSELWPMLAEGKSIPTKSMMVMRRVDIKVTQTNDIGVLLNVISQIDISKRLEWLLTKY